MWHQIVIYSLLTCTSELTDVLMENELSTYIEFYIHTPSNSMSDHIFEIILVRSQGRIGA